MMKRSNAFTLMELLIASAIFTVIGVVIYSSFHIGIFGFRDIEDLLNSYQTAQFIIGRINRDLRNAFAYSRLDAGFKGGPSEMSFITLANIFQDEQVHCEVAFVVYKYEDKKLRYFYQGINKIVEGESRGKSEEMGDNLEIRFEYAKSTTGLDELGFKDYWASGDADAGQENLTLPVAVRLNLTIGSKNKRRFVRTIFLPSGG
ncbi:MAG: prepilin-type N-terminal cleavage/methylation domain-containing protein [Candidatus Omnitrophica bacterium]|nr:prepilin-type N-terminal cleavage/methylation domain-containing protein [Candidatus Omnitrophota bacterium]